VSPLPSFRIHPARLCRWAGLAILGGLLLIQLWPLVSPVRPGPVAPLTTSPGATSTPRSTLALLAGWLEAGAPQDGTALRVEGELVAGLRRSGFVHFLERAALEFVRSRQGRPGTGFMDPGQATTYEYLFGRGDQEAARYLRGWLQEGSAHEQALYVQVGEGFFSGAFRGEGWLPFLEPLDLKGRTVCDLGGGVGYLSFMLAERCQPAKVYLADIDPSGFDFVAFASRRPEFRSLAGVHCHTVPFPGEEPRLPEPVDAILMSDVHALRSPDYETRGRTLLRNLPRELRPGGLVAIHERWVDAERAFSFRELREMVTARLAACGYEVLLFSPGRVGTPGSHPQAYNVYARPQAHPKGPSPLLRPR